MNLFNLFKRRATSIPGKECWHMSRSLSYWEKPSDTPEEAASKQRYDAALLCDSMIVEVYGFTLTNVVDKNWVVPESYIPGNYYYQPNGKVVRIKVSFAFTRLP